MVRCGTERRYDPVQPSTQGTHSTHSTHSTARTAQHSTARTAQHAQHTPSRCCWATATGWPHPVQNLLPAGRIVLHPRHHVRVASVVVSLPPLASLPARERAGLGGGGAGWLGTRTLGAADAGPSDAAGARSCVAGMRGWSKVVAPPPAPSILGRAGTGAAARGGTGMGIWALGVLGGSAAARELSAAVGRLEVAGAGGARRRGRSRMSASGCSGFCLL